MWPSHDRPQATSLTRLNEDNGAERGTVHEFVARTGPTSNGACLLCWTALCGARDGIAEEETRRRSGLAIRLFPARSFRRKKWCNRQRESFNGLSANSAYTAGCLCERRERGERGESEPIIRVRCISNLGYATACSRRRPHFLPRVPFRSWGNKSPCGAPQPCVENSQSLCLCPALD